MKITICVPILLSIILAGCGPSALDKTPWPPPKVGESGGYLIGFAAAASTEEVSGTERATATVAVGTNHGRSLPAGIVQTFDETSSTIVRFGRFSEPCNVIVWVGVDQAGNQYFLGEQINGAAWDIVKDEKPPIGWPADVRPGTSWQYAAHLTSGAVEYCELKCEGEETLKLSSGECQAYKITVSMHHSGLGMHLTGSYWASPKVSSSLPLKCDFVGQPRGYPVDVHVVETLESVTQAK